MTWETSRSLLEIKTRVLKGAEVTASEEGADALGGILKKTIESDKNWDLALEAISILSEQSGEAQWLADAVAKAEKEGFIWREVDAFADKIADLKGKQVPPVLEVVLAAKGEEWMVQLCLALPLRMWKNMTTCLEKNELGLDLLQQKLTERFDKKNVNCDQIMWVWKSKMKDKERLITHTTLFQTLRKDTFKHFNKARTQLQALVSDNEKFLTFLTGKGDPKKVESLLEHLRTYRSSSGIDEKSLMLRVADLFPEAQKKIEKQATGGEERELIDMSITSYASYAMYQQRLREIQEEIPENKVQIQRAREFGDFSENSELDAAKERQRYLLARQKELTEALQEVEPFDFSVVHVGKEVVQGSSVTLDIAGEAAVYHILGVWDSQPERKILSSGADLTQALVGKKEGDQVKLPSGKEAVIKAVSKLDAEIAALVASEESGN